MPDLDSQIFNGLCSVPLLKNKKERKRGTYLVRSLGFSYNGFSRLYGFVVGLVYVLSVEEAD